MGPVGGRKRVTCACGVKGGNNPARVTRGERDVSNERAIHNGVFQHPNQSSTLNLSTPHLQDLRHPRATALMRMHHHGRRDLSL